MSIALSKSLLLLALVCGVMRVVDADTSIFDNSISMQPADAEWESHSWLRRAVMLIATGRHSLL